MSYPQYPDPGQYPDVGPGQYPPAGGYPDASMAGATPGPRGPQMQVWQRGHIASVRLASWPWRMASGLIDYVPLYIITAVFSAVHVVAIGIVIDIVAVLVNNVYMQGTTGQSLGKRIVGTRTVTAVNDGPMSFNLVYPGVGRCFGRQLGHIVDTVLFYLGYLRPLWQYQYRTWADSMAHTVVIARSEGYVNLRAREQGETLTRGV